MRARPERAVGLLLCMGLGCADDASPRVQSILDITAQPDAETSVPMDASVEARVPADAGPRAPLQCPAQPADCTSEQPPWRVIAEASDFGLGANFVALAGDLVLVRGGSSPWRVLRFGPELAPGEPGRVTSFAFPPGNWDALGLARTQREQAGAAVLACERDRPRCVLLEATLTEPGPLLERATLPADFVASGLRAAGPLLCAFGSGISCFDHGVWTNSLTLAADERVLALALASPRSLALTASGRVFSGALASAASLPSWLEESPLAGLTQLAVAGTRSLFYGQDGWVERSDGQDSRCALPAGVAAAFLQFGGSRPVVLTGAGDLLTSPDGTSLCRSAQVALAQPVLAASSGACGSDTDLRVLTATQLIGDNTCALQ